MPAPGVPKRPPVKVLPELPVIERELNITGQICYLCSERRHLTLNALCLSRGIQLLAHCYFAAPTKTPTPVMTTYGGLLWATTRPRVEQ